MPQTLQEAFKNSPISIITRLLIIIGALNWLAVGALNTNYVSKYAGEHAKTIFILVGIAGIYQLYRFIYWSSEGALSLPQSINNLLQIVDKHNAKTD